MKNVNARAHNENLRRFHMRLHLVTQFKKASITNEIQLVSLKKFLKSIKNVFMLKENAKSHLNSQQKTLIKKQRQYINILNIIKSI